MFVNAGATAGASKSPGGFLRSRIQPGFVATDRSTRVILQGFVDVPAMLAPHQFAVTDDFLVTGATGLVGNNVVRQLVSRGQSVRVLVRGRGQTVDRAFAGLPVERRSGELDDARSLEAAADGAAVVIHSAAMVHCGWRHLDEMREVNVAGTRRVARAARLAGARLIHVSSVDAIGLRPDGRPADEETPPGGMPECPYVVTKREAEAAVLEEVDRGLDAVIVNPVYMVGPWDWKPSSGRMLLEVSAGKGLFAPPGGNDFVDVRDVAAGILAAIERGRTGRRYILGGHGLSYLEAWRIFARVTGRMQPLGMAPPAAVRMAGWLGDAVSLFTRRERPVNSAATAMSMLAHNFSTRRAEAELGYTYRSFEATVQDAWEWFLERGYARAARTRTALAR
jgi:dihydroflavonol-4-reductase